MIPIGRHAAKATGAKLCTSKNNNAYVAVEFRLTETGEHITWSGWLTEKTEEVTIRSLRYCGWTGNRLSDLSTVTNNEVSLTVEHEEYENKTRARVRWINPLGGIAALQGMSDSDAEELSRAYENRIAAIEEAAKRKSGQLPGDGDTQPF